MNVFFTGAAGYIWFKRSHAFHRAGHSVIGLIPNESRAAMDCDAEVVHATP